MASKLEGPDSSGIEPGPVASASDSSNQLSTPSAAPQNDNQSALRRQLKAALAQAKDDPPEANIARQLQLLNHRGPFVLQALQDWRPSPDDEPRLWKSALCDSPEMAAALIKKLERERLTVIGFFIVMNQVSEAHAKKLKLGEWKTQKKPVINGKANPKFDADKHVVPTYDEDIQSRKVILIDFDPDRPSHTSSTSAQLLIATKAALDCFEFLHETMCELDIDPACMHAAMSGNGDHVPIFADDLPNTAEVKRLVADVLNAIKARFERPGVLTVDEKVCDAKRLCPLYGTVKRKGESTPETPHRRTFITDGPVARLTLDQLRRLHAKLCPELVDVDALLRERSLDSANGNSSDRILSNGNATPYGQAVLNRVIDAIPKQPPGDRHYPILRMARNVAGFVAGGELADCLPELRSVCPPEHVRALEDGYADGLKHPRSAPNKITYKQVDGVQYAIVPKLASALPPPPAVWNPLEPLERSDKPLPLFPIHVLPRVLRDWVEAMSVMVQQPYDIAATMGFGAASTCLQRTHEIRVHHDWGETCGVYVTAVAPSGSTKTAILEASIKEIRAYQRQARENFGRERARWKIRKQQLEQRLKAEEDEDAKIGLQCELDILVDNEPQRPQLISDDPTQEGLIDALRAQGGSIGLLTDEGKGLYSLWIGRYSERGDSKIELVLKGFGGNYEGNRRGSQQDIENIRIAIANSIQPYYVELMISNRELMLSGLMPRFLISYPQSTMGFRDSTIRPMPTGIQEAYDRVLRALLGGYSVGQPIHIIRVTPDVVERLEKYKASFEGSLRDGARYEAMRAWLSKSAGFALKLAAIIQAFEHPECPHQKPLSIDTIESAIELINYYREHYFRLIDRAYAHEKASTAKLLEWIRRKEITSFTAREARQNVRAMKDKTTLSDTLETLAEKAHIRAVARGQTITYEVNPAVFEVSTEAPDTLPVRTHEAPPIIEAPTEDDDVIEPTPVVNSTSELDPYAEVRAALMEV